MADLSWRDAVLKILNESQEPMHYAEIAEKFAEQELKERVGATPVPSARPARGGLRGTRN